MSKIKSQRSIERGKITQNSGVDAERVRESIVSALEAQPKPVGRMERNEFIREVLALLRASC